MLFVLSAAITIVPAGDASAAMIWYTDLLARPRPVPTKTVSYGPTDQQRGALFLPAKDKSPYPVIVVIHGGCWLAQFPGPELMDYLAADLQRRGYAVWNIAYRRLGEAGGGYPGTFLDVADAMDSLRTLASENGLDLSRVIAVGHSAGGHLALWAAARAHLPKTSRLYRANPLPIHGVVSLGGIADLEDYRADGPLACGGPGTIDRLTGPSTPEHNDIYGDTSPARLLPIGVPYVVASGTLDRIVPERFGARFAAKGRAAHDRVREIVFPDAGHFELIDPQSSTWKSVVTEVDALAAR